MKLLLLIFLLLFPLHHPAFAQESPHAVWISAGVGGSGFGGFPVALGYEYQASPRISLIGMLQRTATQYEQTYYRQTASTVKESNLGLYGGVRLYAKPDNVLNKRLVPFIELGLMSISQRSKSDGPYGTYRERLIRPSFSVGCLFAPTTKSGLWAKMNFVSLSFIDLGYTYHF